MPFFVGRFRTFMWDYWEASFRGWKDVLISGDEFRWKNYRIRCMTLGSLLQLQRMGNPYGRLGEIDLGSGGGMWEALGVEDMGARVYFLAEFLWVHMADAEEVRDGVLECAEDRREMVERWGMRIPGKDLVELECVVLGDIETIQAGMVYTETEGDGEEEDGPLGRGRGGERP